MLKHHNHSLMLFTASGLLFIGVDIYIGHINGGLKNPFMWTPMIILPLSSAYAFVVAFYATQKTQKIFQGICYLVILVGALGFFFHVSRLSADLHGSYQLEVVFRLMRYPPVLAPIAVLGLGILGVLVNQQKLSDKDRQC